MSTRIDRLQAALQAAGLDALALVPGANLSYLTGLNFLTKLRLMLAIVPARGAPVLVVPELEAARASALAQVPLAHYPWADGEGPAAALRRATDALGLAGKRVGIEHNVMRVFELRALEAAAEAEVADASDLLAAMRMVKDEDELAAMREAVRIIEESLAQTIAQMRAGMTERQVAAIWHDAIAAAGSVPSFEAAVAAGPNGASPHHVNGDRPLQAGDLVVMDGGAYYQGYASDITRTVAIGAISAEARRVYDLVLAANTAGRAAAAQPGASGASVDAAARQVIADGGYGQYFIHRTGHGLGMDVHEPPFIVAGSTATLPVGATFTIEPGIYLPGVCGVRIEDDMVITPDGAISLTTFERGLIVVEQ